MLRINSPIGEYILSLEAFGNQLVELLSCFSGKGGDSSRNIFSDQVIKINAVDSIFDQVNDVIQA
jgi:hypothetical protein